MTVAEALKGSGIELLEAEVLLSALLEHPRSWILAHPEYVLSEEQASQWTKVLQRRRGGEPVDYITGRREFYGRTFRCDPRALIPRPCTESLIAMTLDVLDDGEGRERVIDNGILGIAVTWDDACEVRTIVDIGTGTGCIGITLVLERPDHRVILTDRSSEALALATENAALLKAGVEVRKGDALAPLHDLAEPFLIVSNPPYIPDADVLPHDVEAFEPRMALRAGADGGDVLHAIISQARSHPWCRGCVIECLESQRPIVQGT